MRDLVTTVFEILGLLLIAVSAGMALAEVNTALGVAGAGLVLLVESVMIDVLGGKTKQPAGDVA